MPSSPVASGGGGPQTSRGGYRGQLSLEMAAADHEQKLNRAVEVSATATAVDQARRLHRRVGAWRWRRRRAKGRFNTEQPWWCGGGARGAKSCAEDEADGSSVEVAAGGQSRAGSLRPYSESLQVRRCAEDTSIKDK